VGQRWADLDPLKRTERPSIPDLEPSFYGFTDADQETVFDTSNTFFGKNSMSLRELLNALRETYCGTLGAEYMYATDQAEKRWWQEKLESIRSKPNFNAEKKKYSRALNRCRRPRAFPPHQICRTKAFLLRRW
jgi:2-oxoglutarate dehydrogenase E1 component